MYTEFSSRQNFISSLMQRLSTKQPKDQDIISK